jgi:hypothetical protein
VTREDDDDDDDNNNNNNNKCSILYILKFQRQNY